MKIGKIELSDWKFQHHNVNSPNEWYGWYRSVGKHDDTSVAFYSSPKDIGWRIHFGGELFFLNLTYDKKIMIAPADEVKNCVDIFLHRISGLTAFI